MILAERLSLYIQLTRLHRPIGILLLLWPTLWGVWIAGEGHPAWHIAAIFILGTALMRSAGCAINDYADRHIDKYVERTKERPLTSGKVSERETVWLAAGLALAAFLLILPLNPLTWLLSFPALFLAASYPFTKRFLVIPQAYLGIAFGFGIPMAFAAQLGEVPLMAWLLLLANVFWAIAYDTEYAMVDRDDDMHLGIHSSAPSSRAEAVKNASRLSCITTGSARRCLRALRWIIWCAPGSSVARIPLSLHPGYKF